LALRQRHMPFNIGIEARDQWMECMRFALNQTIIDPLFKDVLTESFLQLADHMRNQGDRCG
ncbi:MAG TPA: hypothetical protein HPP64_09650, partial [Gammaproteobacteria bacterium]|nr:hypothetical protein [Gammaproteobacteria bacterium]HIJ26157.1 hypothetical protein [Gammaproteobacteria bacterium]HIJ32049.1 hypothetical protein [Gammaproteobacteria bacterium]